MDVNQSIPIHDELIKCLVTDFQALKRQAQDMGIDLQIERERRRALEVSVDQLSSDNLRQQDLIDQQTRMLETVNSVVLPVIMQMIQRLNHAGFGDVDHHFNNNNNNAPMQRGSQEVPSQGSDDMEEGKL
jgi:hypothetical protein